MEGQLQTQNAEIQSLKELAECQGEGQNLLEDLEAEYNQTLLSLTDRSVHFLFLLDPVTCLWHVKSMASDRKQQCGILIDLLKKFQRCRGHLSSAVLTAEQTISEQASYMGKDNLHRIITKVSRKLGLDEGTRVPHLSSLA